ncbi:NeuD/PglB/VioB family sugar acetyltransferase [Cloacibacillus sp. An23]|uniref:NeuD/PglB/VioB family sugar acetyltransferase n=1 Tax=Cloacibacillus sp. An23 TaxID=1965591 RepID=UPI000B3AF903|nr:NeuD/PglB/VioB family sugar acetyltransferase [Cloacibacillus sp. An23]OUO93093.1 hypothetical protein B5F39_09635 [Cloacibacillus sp. An23]
MTNIKNLVIYGAGGLGREILSLIRRDYADEWRVVGFIVDCDDRPDMVEGIPVFSPEYLKTADLAVVFGFTDTRQKNKRLTQLECYRNLSFPNILSKHAIINKDCKLGKGIVVTDFCSISTKAVIEDGVFLNVGTVIGHDVVIGKACSIMPQCAVSGFVKVGCETFIGAHSFVLQGKTIGNSVTIAAGTVVCRDVCDGGMAMGSPAKVLKCK